MLSHDTNIEQNGQIVTCQIKSPEVAHIEMQELIDTCMDSVRNNNARHFIFDLAEVEFLASSCIGVLVSFLQDIEHTKGRIALANCKENVFFLFKVTRLDSVFCMYDDVQEAVESF
jgi:anti-sigma B factor antagonist